MDGSDSDESDTNSDAFQDAVDTDKVNILETEKETETILEAEEVKAKAEAEDGFCQNIDKLSVEVEDEEDDIIEPPRGDEFPSLEEDITEALKEKDYGNQLFREKLFDDSIDCYSKAILMCPKDDENKFNLATFYGNRSAAYFSLDEHEMVVEDCTEALALKEDYVKVLGRRMHSYEKLDKVEEALTDAKRIQEIDSSYPKIAATVSRLQKAYDLKMSEMKDEALGKLKDLGNSILGNFGMSLDNFKMEQDPSTGSWNMSMGS